METRINIDNPSASDNPNKTLHLSNPGLLLHLTTPPLTRFTLFNTITTAKLFFLGFQFAIELPDPIIKLFD